jgi:CheY-like chemotaxis protein
VTKSSGRPTSVYIAEDNPILLQGRERALTSNGYEVRTADGGRALLDLLEGHELPDIMVIDVMMPGMSGLEVIEALRANPKTAALPVMLITAAAEEMLPTPRFDGDRVDLLLKPFRLNDLLSRIEENVSAARSAATRRPMNVTETALMVDG